MNSKTTLKFLLLIFIFCYGFFVYKLYQKSEIDKLRKQLDLSNVKVQTPKILILGGSVSQSVNSPISYEIEDVYIDISESSQVITFTDRKTKNRITVDGSYALIGYSESQCIIRDWRKKGK